MILEKSKTSELKMFAVPSFLGSSFIVSTFQGFSVACVSTRKVTDEERFALLVFSNFVLENSPRCYPFCQLGSKLTTLLESFPRSAILHTSQPSP